MSDTLTDELLPCPFCGSAGEYIDGERTVSCSNRACFMWVVASVDDWNRRATPHADAGEPSGDAVREALAELVELDDLARAAARLFARLNQPSTKDADYDAYSDMSSDVVRRTPLALKAARAALARTQAPASPVAWAVSRWHAEVANRPLINVHRRSLDDAWRQVIRHFGGDPDALIGPAHDALVAAAPASPAPAAPPVAKWLPCPHCGSTKLSIFDDDTTRPTIGCDECPARCTGGYDDSDDTLIAAWNRRAALSHPAAETPASPLGHCCYGGMKTREDCASCGAWRAASPPAAGRSE